MNKKILIVIFIFIMFISCSKDTKSNGNFIGITVYRTDDEFANSIKNNIQKFISGKAKYIIKDSKNSQITQNDQIDDFISKGAKVLVINLVDSEAAEDVINKAKQNNIPLILFNKSPNIEDMYIYDRVWYVGTISEEAANLQGEIVLNSWKSNPSWDKNGDGKIQCVILKGEPGHIDAEIRTKNVISFLNDNGIETDILESQSGMWDKNKASEIMDSLLQKYESDQIEYIISNNDEMAIGALHSLQSLGYNKNNPDKYIPIVGIDATLEAIEEIKKGTIVGTVLNDAKEQARAVSDLAINLFKGQYNPEFDTDWTLDDTKSVRINYKAITIENADNLE